MDGLDVALDGQLGIGIHDRASGHPELAGQLAARRQLGSPGQAPLAYGVANGPFDPDPPAGSQVHVEVQVHNWFRIVVLDWSDRSDQSALSVTDMDYVTPYKPRYELHTTFRAGAQAMLALSQAAASRDLEGSLVELVNLRVSQLNGCAYCIDMHTKDALAQGESDQRLYAVAAWREAPFFTARERVALAYAEAMTLMASQHLPEEVVDAAHAEFGTEGLANLAYVVVVINSWNRLVLTAHTPVGGYQPQEVISR
jgi:AhpD family alkylhydroperoxidase